MSFLIHYFKKHGARIVVSLSPLLVILLHVIGLVQLGFIQNLDNFVYDTKLRMTMPQSSETRIVIVDIDEKSLAELGQWPWNRQTMSRLTDELFQNQKIAVLGFDIVFAEPDTSSGWQKIAQLAASTLKEDALLQAQLPALKEALDFDGQFARSLSHKNVVLGYYFTSDRDAYTSGHLPQPLFKLETLQGRTIRTSEWDGYGANLPIFAQSASQAGFFNAIADDDGVVRSLPLFAKYKDAYFESFSLVLYKAFVKASGARPQFSGSIAWGAIDSLQVIGADSQPLQTIRVDDRGATLVKYRGLGGTDAGTFKYISASDVIHKKISADALKDKIVLVGSSAPGLQDLRNTPVGQAYPGVEVHANMLAGMLNDTLLYKPDYALGAEVVSLALLGLTLACVLPALSAVGALGFSLVMMLVPAALNVYLFESYGIVLPLATILLLSVLVFMLNMTYGYLVESRAKRELTKLFGSYVPPKLVEGMVQNPSLHSMKAENRELTVMFCDLRGYTQLAEKLAPVALQDLLNSIFGRITQIVLAQNGTLDKYMGDCVMAFWGAPVSMPNHAALAVHTAIEITKSIEQLNVEHRAKSLPEIRLGIGINTGMMCVGDMGSYLRRSYTVVGDAVNIASRLENLTKDYHVEILASECTRNKAASFDWIAIDRLQLKGKSEDLSIYALK